MFEEVSKTSDREKRYASAMTFFSTGPGLEVSHVLNGFDWASIGKGKVVDVGGSHGSLSIAIARRYPDITLVVQDRPPTVREGLANLPPELADRMTFMTHDFFKEQPILHADVYVLRWILHDWSDKYAIRILQALKPALKDGANIVIVEHVLPGPGSVPAYQERGLRSDSFPWRICQDLLTHAM